tara:strand:- start:4489 stop:4875 length:387 start_codon:yes stop_codon:yes gene_type:complete
MQKIDMNGFPREVLAPAQSYGVGTTHGTGRDLHYARSIIPMLSIGDVGAAGTITCMIQDSPDNVTWTTQATLCAARATTGALITQIDDPQRYVRSVIESAVNAVVASVMVFGIHTRRAPETSATFTEA